MADSSLKVVITAVDKASKELGKVSGGFSKVSKAGLIAGAGVAAFGVSSVKAYSEAEAAQAKLQDSYDKFPRLADVSIESLRDFNSELQKKTRFDDDAVASGQAVLAQYELTGEQLQELTPLVADYAAKTGQSFEAASAAIGKAMLGSGKALKTVGIEFEDTGTQAGNLDQIMAGLRTQVGGFAEKEALTGAGAAERLKNQFGEVQETVGAELVPVLTKLAGVATDVIGAFNDLPDPVKNTALAIGGVVTGVVVLAPRIMDAVGALSDMRAGLMKVRGASIVTAASVGLVSAAVGLLAYGYMEAQAAQDELTKFAPDRMQDFAESIGVARARVADLEDGIDSLGDGVEWFRDAANFEKWDEGWRKGAQLITGYNSALQDIQYTTGATKELVAATAAEVWDENKAYVENKDAVREAVAAKSGGTDAAIKLAEAEGLAGDAAGTAADKTKAYKDALDALNAPALDVRSSMRAYEESIDAATEALKENGRTLDIGTEKGRSNQAALDSIATDARRAGAAIREKDGHDKNSNETLKVARTRLQAQAEAFGMSREAARRYVDKVLAIPTGRKTKVILDTAGANKNLGDLFKKWDGKVINWSVGIPKGGGPNGEWMIPGRASGGPVRAGRPYIVGEHQPELFVPNQSGTILPRVPSSPGSAYGGQTVVNVYTLSTDEAGLARHLDRIMRENRSRGLGAA